MQTVFGSGLAKGEESAWVVSLGNSISIALPFGLLCRGDKRGTQYGVIIPSLARVSMSETCMHLGPELVCDVNC